MNKFSAGRLDNFGRPLNIGDFVMRRRKSEDGDFFKCHPGSFGVIKDFVIEDIWTRPELSELGPEDVVEWEEVQVVPQFRGMKPEREELIQWSPSECIKIPGLLFLYLVILWPAVKLIWRKPLDGRATDY